MSKIFALRSLYLGQYLRNESDKSEPASLGLGRPKGESVYHKGQFHLMTVTLTVRTGGVRSDLPALIA